MCYRSALFVPLAVHCVSWIVRLRCVVQVNPVSEATVLAETSNAYLVVLLLAVLQCCFPSHRSHLCSWCTEGVMWWTPLHVALNLPQHLDLVSARSSLCVQHCCVHSFAYLWASVAAWFVCCSSICSRPVSTLLPLSDWKYELY